MAWPASASAPTRPISIPARCSISPPAPRPSESQCRGAGTPSGITVRAGRRAFVRPFEPVEVLQTIQTEKVTHAQFVPTMINMMVNHPRFAEFDIHTLQFILYGASPMPEGVLRKALRVMPHVRLMH